MSNMQPEEYENTGWLSYFSRHKTTYTASDIHKISNELNNVRKNLTATQYAYGELSSELKALKSLQEQQRLVDEYEQRAASSSSKGAKSTEKRLKEQADEIKSLKSDLASCRNELSKQITAVKVAISEQSKKKALSGSGKSSAGNAGITLSLESRIIAAEVQLDQLVAGQTTDRLSALEQKVGQLEQTRAGGGDYESRLNAIERDFTRKLQDLTDLVVELQRKLAKSEAKQVEMVQRLSAAQTTLYEQLEHRYDEQCGKLRELQVRLKHLGQNDDIDSTFV
ncbi:uncharacterized protein LOC126565189 [Anopheles maculipalpis]|uniref:uncharacterized protein LOC126565189 n=1 Tax=Anopheles maculipalpis TaxID=1496333 RepID=UPI0021593D53|nr:uncharacterized protein LOC126565189 [Anopheles maculipalpis]